MMRGARVALVVVVIFSIAYVLVTLDPTHDVVGVLRSNRPAMAQSLLAGFLWQSEIPVIVLFHLFTTLYLYSKFGRVELLDLISVCRC